VVVILGEEGATTSEGMTDLGLRLHHQGENVNGNREMMEGDAPGKEIMDTSEDDSRLPDDRQKLMKILLWQYMLSSFVKTKK